MPFWYSSAYNTKIRKPLKQAITLISAASFLLMRNVTLLSLIRSGNNRQTGSALRTRTGRTCASLRRCLSLDRMALRLLADEAVIADLHMQTARVDIIGCLMLLHDRVKL